MIAFLRGILDIWISPFVLLIFALANLRKKGPAKAGPGQTSRYRVTGRRGRNRT